MLQILIEIVFRKKQNKTTFLVASGRAIEEKKREGGKGRERQVEQREMKSKMS